MKICKGTHTERERQVNREGGGRGRGEERRRVRLSLEAELEPEWILNGMDSGMMMDIPSPCLLVLIPSLSSLSISCREVR